MAKATKKVPPNEQQQFFEDYLRSPNYRKRLVEQGYMNPQGIIDARLTNLSNTNIVPSNADTSFYKDRRIGYSPQDEKEGFLKNSILAHEYSHSAGSSMFNTQQNPYLELNPRETQQIESRNKLNKNTDRPPNMSLLNWMHDKQASESKADLDTLRYRLKKDKVFDTGTQEFDKGTLQKARQLYKDDKNVNRLLGNFSDDDLIYLMNNIATTSPEESSIAKNGAQMAKKIKKAKSGLIVEPKYFEYENLPCVGCKDHLMADFGMYMGPGPKMPGLAESLQKTLPHMPPLFENKGPNVSTLPIPGYPQKPDTDKIQPGQFINPYQYNKPQNPPPPEKKNKFNPGNAALLGMAAFDAILPNPYLHQQVVQPQMAYNPNPYGTGSQAIMEDGGPVPMPKTNLTPQQEAKYNEWKGKLPKNLQYEGNYNLRQLWLENPNQKPSANIHFPDRYKLPNHPTFSNESMYFNPTNQYMGGHWQETDSSWNYMPYNSQYKDMVVEKKGEFGYVLGEDENNSPSAKNGKQMKSKNKNLGASLFGFTDNALPEAKDGHWIQGAVNPAHKGYCTPMTKSTCTPRRKALAKTFKKHHGFHKKENGGHINDFMDMITAHMKQGGIIPDPMSAFNPHQYEDGGNVNGGAKLREVGATYPNTDLLEQWLLYANGGNVNGDAKINEVGPRYPNTDLLEQWLLYADGGGVPGNRYLRPSLVKDSENRAPFKGGRAKFYNDFRDRDIRYNNDGSVLQPMSLVDVTPASGHNAQIPEPGYSPMNLSQPTNYSVTYPEAGQQHSAYFQDFNKWNDFVNNNSGLLVDSQYNNANTKASATLKNRPMEQGGSVNGSAKIREVDAKFPNTDLLEQWLLYENGGQLSSAKAKEMLRDGTANGKKLTSKQKKYFGMVAAGKAAMGTEIGNGPGDPPSAQEKYYQSSARLSYYKDQLNQKLKAKNPQAFGDYFKGLVDLRRANNPTGAEKYVQDSQYNEYLTPQEVQSSLGDKYNDYLESIKNVNAFNVAQGKQPLYGNIEGQNDINNLNYGRRFASLQITPSVSVHNDTRNTNYDRRYTYDPKTNAVDFTESGDMKLRPDYLSTRPAPTVRFKQGGVMYDDGGTVDTMWGGSADMESYNPYDGGTIAFNGPSHDQGGIGMAYNGNPVEVEGGEYASKDADGNLNIYGNMFIPGTKTKFKKAAKGIADKEKRYNFLKDKGSKLVNEANPANKYDQLAFNAGRVMMQGGQMGQADLATKKEQLASLQKAMLDMASQHGLDPFEMSKGKMKKAKGGASVPFYENGGSDPGGNDPTRADRNMNPGNIKYGDFAKKYGAKKDKDGFAIFKDRATGERAMKDLLTSKSYSDMSARDAIRKWTGGNPYRYDLGPLTDKKISEMNPDELSIVMGTMTKGEGTRYGVGPRPVDKTVPTTPLGTPSFTPYRLPDYPINKPVPPADHRNPAPGYDQLNPPGADKNPPSNVEPLHLNQLLGEIYAAATNKVEPVPAQRYEPQLYSPYQVSFQDRLNANQSAYNAQQRMVGAGNPSALGALAAQKYQGDQAVYADEFRTNQAIANDITNKNIALVNDANLKNLGIADTQMTRQSQARSKTRELNQMILNSISDKYAKNSFENKKLAAYENLYDYRFVPTEDGGLKATYFGPNAQFNYDGRVAQDYANPSRRISRYDAQGNLKGYADYDDSDLKDYQKLLQVMKLQNSMPLMQVPSLDGK